MDKMLSRCEEMVQFFESFDRSKVKLWLFTNAHVSHGLRVTDLLGITHFFEGITYCDYASDTWICKPSQQMLAKAEREANVTSSTDCFYVDDNVKNCQAASQRGWQVLCISNRDRLPPTSLPESVSTITDLQEIQNKYPQFLRAEQLEV